MPFIFGKGSLEELSSVEYPLQAVCFRALQLTAVDFSVVEGRRKVERQIELVKQGKSRTYDSKHILGRAVDLVPYINGKLDWSTWDNFYVLAEYMSVAAEELGVILRWGGYWSSYAFTAGKAFEHKRRVQKYVHGRKLAGKTAFIDGPHFELP